MSRYLPAYHQQARIFAYMMAGMHEKARVLDLGCGGGSLSYLVMQISKKSTVVGFDQNPEALEAYMRNLSAFSGRVATVKGDISYDDLGMGYDLVVASMALGNIENQFKETLCSRIFASLKPGGLFISRDFLLGSSPGLNACYERSWLQEMKSSELEKGSFDAETTLCEHPAPLRQYLQLLENEGFVDVDCHWRYLNFAIFGGRKPDSDETGPANQLQMEDSDHESYQPD